MTPPHLKRPATLTPPHRLTWAALSGAVQLADLLTPITPAQKAAQQKIVAAARSGDLIATYHAIDEARQSRHIGTPVWRREWALDWLRKVQEHIFREVRALARDRAASAA